jgi:hypothetical protein
LAKRRSATYVKRKILRLFKQPALIRLNLRRFADNLLRGGDV